MRALFGRPSTRVEHASSNISRQPRVEEMYFSCSPPRLGARRGGGDYPPRLARALGLASRTEASKTRHERPRCGLEPLLAVRPRALANRAASHVARVDGHVHDVGVAVDGLARGHPLLVDHHLRAAGCFSGRAGIRSHAAVPLQARRGGASKTSPPSTRDVFPLDARRGNAVPLDARRGNVVPLQARRGGAPDETPCRGNAFPRRASRTRRPSPARRGRQTYSRRWRRPSSRPSRRW